MTDDKPAGKPAPPRFKWFEAGAIAASGRPDGEEQLAFVADEGIKQVVSVTQAEPEHEVIAGLGMQVTHAPGVRDDPEAMDRAADAIQAAVRSQQQVLVH